MGENQGRGGHVLAPVSGRNIHDNAEIKVMIVESGDQPLRRLAEHGEKSDHATGICITLTRSLQAERRHDHVPQIQQRLHPTRIAGKYALGRRPRIELRHR